MMWFSWPANFLFNIVSDMDYARSQQLVIQKAADVLVPGGHLYIDYGYTRHPESWFNAPAPQVVWGGTDSSGIRGRMVLHDGAFHPDTGLYTFTRRIELHTANGEDILQAFPSVKHFATLEQIHVWLQDAGFSVEEEYGGYDRQPIGVATNRAIIWAQKC